MTIIERIQPNKVKKVVRELYENHPEWVGTSATPTGIFAAMGETQVPVMKVILSYTNNSVTLITDGIEIDEAAIRAEIQDIAN